jgi:hypothetical protein
MNEPTLPHDEAVALLSGMPDPATVRALESALLQMPQVDLQTSHVVHGGLCARTILIPAGTVLTGALTAKDNVCVICGDITVTTDAGPQRLTGFHVIPANAGAKRVGIAHADTWWTTLHRTELTDIKAIEDEMTPEAAQLQTRQVLGFERPASLEVSA